MNDQSADFQDDIDIEAQTVTKINKVINTSNNNYYLSLAGFLLLIAGFTILCLSGYSSNDSSSINITIDSASSKQLLMQETLTVTMQKSDDHDQHHSPKLLEECHDTLGITQNATIQEINEAYRNLALQHHPDWFPNQRDKDVHGPIFVKVKACFDKLTDTQETQQHSSDAPASTYNESSTYNQYYFTMAVQELNEMLSLSQFIKQEIIFFANSKTTVPEDVPMSLSDFLEAMDYKRKVWYRAAKDILFETHLLQAYDCMLQLEAKEEPISWNNILLILQYCFMKSFDKEYHERPDTSYFNVLLGGYNESSVYTHTEQLVEKFVLHINDKDLAEVAQTLKQQDLVLHKFIRLAMEIQSICDETNIHPNETLRQIKTRAIYLIDIQIQTECTDQTLEVAVEDLLNKNSGNKVKDTEQLIVKSIWDQLTITNLYSFEKHNLGSDYYKKVLLSLFPDGQNKPSLQVVNSQ